MFENLRRKGWRPQSESRPLHVLASAVASSFSTTMLDKRCRPYFQVLDSLPALFAKGLARVTHTQPASYYAAVLSSETPGAVLENERAAYYEPMVEDERGDLAGDVGDSLSDGAVGSDDDGDFILPGDAPAAVAAPAAAAAPPVAAAAADAVCSTSSSGDSSSGESSSSSMSVVAAGAEEVPDYLEEVYAGVYRIKLERYVDLLRPGRGHKRFRVICIEHGDSCAKRRGVGARHERRHGRLEPIAYCLAWARQGHRFASKADHIRHKVTEVEVDAALQCMKDLGAV